MFGSNYSDAIKMQQTYYIFQQELLSRLLGLAYAKNIYTANVGVVSIAMSNDGQYQITHESNMDQFEATMLVLGQPERWDQDFEAMFQDKLEQYHVPPYGGTIDETCTRPLFLFRLAVAYLRDPAGGAMVVQKNPVSLPDIPAMEGQFIGKDEDENEDHEWTDEERKAQANKVEYAALEGLPVGATILEIILIANEDEAEKQILFNAERLRNLPDNQRPDLNDVSYDRIVFVLNDGTAFVLHNESEGDYGCDVSIHLVDIEGDLFDLIDRPLVVSETASHRPPEKCCDSETWTYYRIATPKGMVSLRWHGRSNSYYSEAVSHGVLKGAKIAPGILADNNSINEFLEE